MNYKRLLPLAWLLTAGAFTGCLQDNEDFAAGQPSPIISIDDVRRLYQGTDVALTTQNLAGARQLVGVVVSDTSGRNVPGGPRAVVVQNKRRGLTRGLLLPLPAGAPGFSVGDSVTADLTGTTLARRDGSLRVEGLSMTSVTKVGTSPAPRPQETSIESLLANLGQLEGTLVRLNGGSITPLPVSGDTYGGDKVLVDGAGRRVVLHTEAGARFAGRRMPASATFVGLAVGGQDAAGQPVVQLWLRSAADAIDPSGPVYHNFPESFEAVPAATKASYNMNTAALPDNTVTFGSGPWKLYQAILGNTAGRDRYTGTQGLRLQQGLTEPAVVEMKFDLPNGASKVTLLYGAYYTDAASSWKLEYSQDQGQTWQQTGPLVTDAGNWQRSVTFLLNLSGPVRFRIHKLGLGPSSPPTVLNGRLGLDDIAIYEN